MVRAFIALDLPEETRRTVGELQARLQRARLGVSVSWVKNENLHLTLQFLGYVPDEKIPTLSASLERIGEAQPPFEMRVAGLGAFPDTRRPRVIWVGCEDAQGRLHRLADAVRAAMQPLGLEPERREFAAHLTLGRVRSPRPDATLTKLLDSLRDWDGGTVLVEAVHLFESQLNPQGSIYTKLSSHPLKGVANHGSEN